MPETLAARATDAVTTAMSSAAAAFDQGIFELETYGFTIIPQVLSHHEVAVLRALGARLDRERGEDSAFLGTARHLSNLIPRDPAYFPMIDHLRILPYIERLLGPDIILASLNSRIVRPHDPDQGLHGDVPAGLRRPGQPIMVNTVWMLDDWTTLSGATRVVPGSHHMPQEMPPAERQLPHLLQALAPAGSVLIFDGRLWHGGGMNMGTQDRHGLFGHYRTGSWTSFQCDPHQDFPPAWLERLSPRQRRLLRMQDGVRPARWVDDRG